MLKDEYGDKLHVFNMDDVVREALAYVIQTRTPKEEAPDPKAKGGKGKEKVEAPVEMFAGKDTVAYKEVACNVFKTVSIAFGSDEIPGKNVDLIHMVSDDQLLVNLFIEKLCLEYDTPPTSKDDVEK